MRNGASRTPRPPRSRFSLRSRVLGGLGSIESRETASQVFKAMLCGRVGEWEISVELVSTWQCVWPRPQPENADVLALPMRCAAIDLSALRARSEAHPPNNAASCWWRHIVSAFGCPTGKTHLHLVVGRLVGCKH